MAITVLEAHQLLNQMSISDYPHMKSSDRSKWHQQVHARANAYQKKPEAMSTVELAKFLRAKIRG